MPFLLVKRRKVIIFACLALLLGLSACQTAKAAPSQLHAPTQAAVLSTQTAVPTVLPASTATPDRLSLGLPDYLPQQLKETIKLPAGWSIATGDPKASLQFELVKDQSADSNSVNWVYVLVAPFPTVTDAYTLDGLRSSWETGPDSDAPFTSILVDSSTQAIFTQLWGTPSKAVKVVSIDKLLDTAWAEKTAWAIVPFEQVEPRWKVIALDDQSPVQKTFKPEDYGLTIHFAPQGNADLVKQLLAGGPIADTNRRADRLTTVMVTGVTALVRGTASYMEGRGIDYPAQFIGDWLREADILHVSNEVSFAKNCPPPFDWMGLKFCSRPKYLQLLKDVGTDVVELTGDHLDDWGKDAFLYTLQLYKEAGIKYYGGGENIEEARQPALFENNGNKIAFIGCNAKEPGYAKASETYPGAIHCNVDEMADSVRKLREEGYLPIMTFQHIEYYSYPANPILQKDFRQIADAGAVIVSGSQAHQPHAMEFRDGGFLHYGLGNLFFDQTNQGDAPRTAFIDRHIFYNGKYINTELLTIYLIDYARSRPMTQPEREQLLKTIFQASGW